MVFNRGRLEKVRREMYLSRFKNELEDSSMFDIDNARVDALKTIIKCIQSDSKDKVRPIEYRDKIHRSRTTYADKIEDYFDQLDVMVYKKRWSRLRSFHKEEKIKQFAKSFSLSNETTKKFTNELLDALNTKNINNDRCIEYDQETMKILSIKGVNVNTEKGTYIVIKIKDVDNT